VSWTHSLVGSVEHLLPVKGQFSYLECGSADTRSLLFINQTLTPGSHRGAHHNAALPQLLPNRVACRVRTGSQDILPTLPGSACSGWYTRGHPVRYSRYSASRGLLLSFCAPTAMVSAVRVIYTIPPRGTPVPTVSRSQAAFMLGIVGLAPAFCVPIAPYISLAIRRSRKGRLSTGRGLLMGADWASYSRYDDTRGASRWCGYEPISQSASAPEARRGIVRYQDGDISRW